MICIKFNSWFTLTTCWIILPNVVINCLFEVTVKPCSYVTVSFLKRLHDTVFTNLYTSIIHREFLNSCANRRLGRIPDLRFGGGVEGANGGGKLFDCIGKFSYYFTFKVTLNCVVNHSPHRLQLTVHGLGGAYIWVGAGFGSRRGKLFVECVGYFEGVI
ncbi:hypothetical protein BOVATA_006920 [Babesia ovata]|uniref:Uncharacterized protein n=1 Tax=Babesia ovata TaxID=189622 RepID=A0A2H6K8C1_9APIC|nr:uncharacterized protein BOVATA_006920 [Babesia ovata]GBE59199.1 hypothetical protein BOVATA_006920 [Babesia ovata]